MTFDLARIWESKREYRRQLAARPIGEKLAMLDAMRQRESAIRGPDHPAGKFRRVVREHPAGNPAEAARGKTTKG